MTEPNDINFDANDESAMYERVSTSLHMTIRTLHYTWLVNQGWNGEEIVSCLAGN